MRNPGFTFTACVVALAGAAAVGAGARSYEALSGRSHELERQNASLRGAYDELRGLAVECLVREEQRVVADDTSTSLTASPLDAERSRASAGRSGPEKPRRGTFGSRP